MVEEGSDRAPDLLLDTNIVIVVPSQEDAALARLQEAAGSFFVSVITLGELRFGARKSGRVEENLQRVEDFAAESTILPCDEGTSRRYGEIKDGLRRNGRPIPENDIWISATALQYGLVLVTRDSHFEHVEGLRSERWYRRHNSEQRRQERKLPAWLTPARACIDLHQSYEARNSR